MVKAHGDGLIMQDRWEAQQGSTRILCIFVITCMSKMVKVYSLDFLHLCWAWSEEGPKTAGLFVPGLEGPSKAEHGITKQSHLIKLGLPPLAVASMDLVWGKACSHVLHPKRSNRTGGTCSRRQPFRGNGCPTRHTAPIRPFFQPLRAFGFGLLMASVKSPLLGFRVVRTL